MGVDKQLLPPAIFQVFEWARAWVDNETCIPETPHKNLTEMEQGALALMDLIEKVDRS